MSNIRIGFGVDVHRLDKDRDLYLGGIKIPSDLGAVGHSDADVLIHAICDAILGACNLGDIGYHFPDTDNQYKNIDSKIILKKVSILMSEEGFSLVNIDSTVILEKPKLAPHLSAMKQTLAEILSMPSSDISIKATTHEKVDSFGKTEAIKAYAVCLLTK
jgi:2-C-methyl-D-erythritol 2,4-cyclodiphosphate synthase